MINVALHFSLTKKKKYITMSESGKVNKYHLGITVLYYNNSRDILRIKEFRKDPGIKIPVAYSSLPI